MTKLKNLNCDKTQKLKLWQTHKFKLWHNSKTQMVRKKIKKNKLWQNLQKLEGWQKKSNCDITKKTWIMISAIYRQQTAASGRTEQSSPHPTRLCDNPNLRETSCGSSTAHAQLSRYAAWMLYRYYTAYIIEVMLCIGGGGGLAGEGSGAGDFGVSDM